jgi:hypothetical protein
VPPGMPKSDPLRILHPLYDSYAAAARPAQHGNPRFSPYVAPHDRLPENMLFVVPAIDILVHEQLTFVERVKAEADADKRTATVESRRIEALYVEHKNAFHGYLNCKSLRSKLSPKCQVWTRTSIALCHRGSRDEDDHELLLIRLYVQYPPGL